MPQLPCGKVCVYKLCLVYFIQEIFINLKKNQQMLPLLITLLEIVALVQQLTLPDILGMLCHL